jgi:ABC-type uncharacterized transport system substrate-binding protein
LHLFGIAAPMHVGASPKQRHMSIILKGAKPADIPAEQPTRFELIVNLKSAKSLGLTLSPTIMSIADELIQ